MPPVIEFSHVSKQYLLGAGARSLRSVMATLPKRLLHQPIAAPPVHWALRDLSFTVQPGASIGLLGHNGAGKTTVLKLLSGITQATQGRVTTTGRVASLIELGAGFHPEMSGRENIYMNALIMGMTRREVERRFESIIDFAEIEQYLDSPVKRYSSGMYVRLAFAIAAHLEPDILLVDEVLAVGDLRFRTKCYRLMAELRRQGATIVLVSHNLVQVRDTCERSLLLWQGELVEDGRTDDVITAYVQKLQGVDQRAHAGALALTAEAGAAKATDPVTIESVCFFDQRGEAVETVVSGDALSIQIDYCALHAVQAPVVHIDFYRDGMIYSGCSTEYDEFPLQPLRSKGSIVLEVDSLHLSPGIYSLSVVIGEGHSQNILAIEHHTHMVEVIRRPNSRGEIRLPHRWLQPAHQLSTEGANL
ncbi:MAG: ABC transporter ATP-binding protein [Caldilinea sp.]|uniref:ABC transporter ATP-binding protein n=1 Tax=Caldilinea sp. TaxID=2293560 RepID=UPI002B89299F|nr:ABC transporter ATP-binding protein [Caldilinea sp.]